MLSKEALEEYRKMTPGQRLSLTLRMIKENTPYLFKVPPEVVERRFELIRRENKFSKLQYADRNCSDAEGQDRFK